jgi:hypothetical protein
VGGDTVGAHLAVLADDDHVVSHAFAAGLAGYVGWMWVVTLARVEDHPPTVDEVVLLPGEDALLAPEWVPWDQRVRPGDLSPGDLLPTSPDDLRLVPAYLADDDDETLVDEAVQQVAWELGLGREQVLSRDGRTWAAERWQDERGPAAPMARQAPAHCGTCGFLLPLAGSLKAGFGVCGNEVTEVDGKVVSVEYGCGAHSSVRAESESSAERGGPVYDDGDVPL